MARCAAVLELVDSWGLEFKKQIPIILKVPYERLAGALGPKKASTWFMIARLIIIFSLLLLGLQVPRSASAQRVRMSYAGTTGFNVPFWLAHEAGLFKKHGLSEDLILISGGSTNIQALLAGEIQFANAAGSAPIQATLQGAEVTIIATSYNVMPYGLVVGKDIRSPADLKGKTLAVSRLGGITEVAGRLALEKMGLGRNSMTFIQAGPDGPRITALQSGAVAATLLAPPGLFAAASLGLRILADLGDLGIEYPTSVNVVSRRYLAQNRSAVKKYLMALVESLHLYKENRQLAVQVTRKYTKLDDQELLSKTYDYFVKNTSFMPLTGAAVIQNGLPAGMERERKTTDFFDNSVLEELIKEGFVKKISSVGSKSGAVSR
jgi:NitT/TauT family transport system substrate-binding protein